MSRSSIKIETRIHCPEKLSLKASITLGPDDAHHLRSVLRLSPGKLVALFNEHDGEWIGEIESLSKANGTVLLKGQSREAAGEPDVWLVFAPIKKQSVDFMVEKACELGCSRLVPVFTRFTNSSRVNTARLRTNSKEASEQCERLSVAEVAEPVSFDQLLASWPEGRQLLVCAEFGEAEPIQVALERKRQESGTGQWAILIGPEGGFAQSELEALRKLPYVTPVGLGPRVLRADTAAVAALACWQAVLGDGSERPPGGTTPVRDDA
ncbi:16S rRNA (uracil(1498)-N(3))-methyltransferase [Kiloniella sp. b19]|uniref:16S rRNA (uracil(1498)-N(3))-methyltransferase n=1 Tax=Kiloniella sp. GXU_MW_B19 TaxID=3141326 RepID=UPI0031D70C53